MTLAYPHYTEFRPISPTAPYYMGAAIGCMVCSTASFSEAFTGQKIANLTDLGNMMGAKCRAWDHCHHGQPQYSTWGACCAMLELKARKVPIGYGKLTWAQAEGRLKKGLPVLMPGIYGRIPRVSEDSYSSTIPAKGRSDSFIGRHAIVAWGVFEYSGGVPTSFICSDPDFGSSSRPTVPPYSIISAQAVKSYFQSLNWNTVYALTQPQFLPVIPQEGLMFYKPTSAKIGTAKFVGAGHQVIDPHTSKVTSTVYPDGRVWPVYSTGKMERPLDNAAGDRQNVLIVDDPSFGAIGYVLITDTDWPAGKL